MTQSNIYGGRVDVLGLQCLAELLINNVLCWTLPTATGSSANHEMKMHVEWVRYKNSGFYFTKTLILKDEALEIEETLVIV